MIKFGTDGWRAIIGEEFNQDNVARVTQAFADFLLQKGAGGEIFLGYDRRRLSPESAENAAEVLAGNGITVLLSDNYCPTPCIAWNTGRHKALAGMMITASHNPSQWNGIKFKESDGGAASPEYTGAVEKILIASSDRKPVRLPLSRGRETNRIRSFDPRKDYLGDASRWVALKEIREKKWRIAYDPLFGAGTGYLGEVLGNLTQIHSEKDPSFGGLNPEPIEKNLSDLIRLVPKDGYDIGLATDGDADRIGAVDETGKFIDPHHIYALILKHLVETRKMRGDVVKTVSTTNMIDRLAEKFDLKMHVTPIGFKHICKKMRETRTLMGGEESGGIAVTSWMLERDGLMAGLLLLEVMSHRGKRLGELIRELHAEIGPHFFSRVDLTVDGNRMGTIQKRFEKPFQTVAGLKVERFETIDGWKFHLAGGSWLLIRPSGTEPLLRLYAEASSPDQVEKLLNAAQEML